MTILEDKFESLKKSQDPNEINDFLIELGKNLDLDLEKYLRFFIENLEPQLISKISLNLIWLLGEIASKSKLNQFFIDYIFISSAYIFFIM